eukprot:TRINITY_DN7722_c0_g1_i1.p1 TRINITY_DN7722_c0_g1~~TRINITY_DN7722_c0_g1_i1.p1  ORF type:complete len:792 (+),score=121.89 TRINITY_DN7722_c0_g1_i1:2-2377(+)
MGGCPVDTERPCLSADRRGGAEHTRAIAPCQPAFAHPSPRARLHRCARVVSGQWISCCPIAPPLVGPECSPHGQRLPEECQCRCPTHPRLYPYPGAEGECVGEDEGQRRAEGETLVPRASAARLIIMGSGPSVAYNGPLPAFGSSEREKAYEAALAGKQGDVRALYFREVGPDGGAAGVSLARMAELVALAGIGAPVLADPEHIRAWHASLEGVPPHGGLGERELGYYLAEAALASSPAELGAPDCADEPAAKAAAVLAKCRDFAFAHAPRKAAAKPAPKPAPPGAGEENEPAPAKHAPKPAPKPSPPQEDADECAPAKHAPKPAPKKHAPKPAPKPSPPGKGVPRTKVIVGGDEGHPIATRMLYGYGSMESGRVKDQALQRAKDDGGDAFTHFSVLWDAHCGAHAGVARTPDIVAATPKRYHSVAFGEPVEAAAKAVYSAAVLTCNGAEECFSAQWRAANYDKNVPGGHLRDTASALAGALRVPQVIIAVNMEGVAPPQRQERFQCIIDELTNPSGILRSETVWGTSGDDVCIIPYLAEGQNVLERSDAMAWWGGRDVTRVCRERGTPQATAVETERVVTLMDALDFLHPLRPRRGHLRMPVSGVHDVKGVGQIAVGSVSQGVVTAGEVVEFISARSPEAARVKATVARVESEGKVVPEGVEGDGVAVVLDGLPSLPEAGDLMTCEGGGQLRGSLTVSGLASMPFAAGNRCEVHTYGGGAPLQAFVKRVVSLSGPQTKGERYADVTDVYQNHSAEVEFELGRPAVVDREATAVIRLEGRLAFFGTVTEVV